MSLAKTEILTLSLRWSFSPDWRNYWSRQSAQKKEHCRFLHHFLHQFSMFDFFLFLLLLSAAVVLRCGVTLFSSQCVTNTGCFLTLSLSIFSLRSAKPKQVFRFLGYGFFSLSFLFDWPSFIFWKGWNCKDWCWSHWTKHKGNCPIFHFLNKTQNIYLFRFHFLSECFDEYCKKNRPRKTKSLEQP